MHGREYFFADRDVDVELFPQLPGETGRQAFRRRRTCRRGTPTAPRGGRPSGVCVIRKRPSRSMTAAQTTMRFTIDLSGLNGNERQLLAIGQIRHLGFRATHTIAPKSISA